MRVRSFVSFYLIAAGALIGQGAPDQASKFQRAMDDAVRVTGVPSVSVAVVSGGKVTFTGTSGKANLEANHPADANTRYAVGSISKEFTAAAILLLAEEGKLSLEDKVSKYFPDLTRANEVTIRQILSHTSGYEDYAPQDYIIPDWLMPTTAQAILDQWAKKPLNFDPGTRWQYSNTNYVLAGEIFEKVSGQPLVGFLKAKIFDPLGMKSAGDCSESSPADATAYTRYALGPPRVVKREAPGWYFAAGELCMTPADLAKWDVAFLQKRILAASSYNQFTHEVRLNNGDLTNYALGLQLGSFRNMPTISHGGEVSGFLAQNTIYPTRAGAVIVLSNEDSINVISPLSQQLATLAFLPEEPSSAEADLDSQTVRSILTGLQQGQIDRALFTSNANSYFTDAALADYKTSLAALGTLRTVTRTGASLRGGMIHRGYRAEFDKKTVLLNTYVMPDGRYEQFLVEDQL